MQNMVDVRKKNAYFATNLFLWNVWKNYFGALGVESPHGGAMEPHDWYAISCKLKKDNSEKEHLKKDTSEKNTSEKEHSEQ